MNSDALITDSVSKVRSVLSPDLLKPKYRGNGNPMFGHCYVASEALWYLLRAQGCQNIAVRVLRISPDLTHWYLWDNTNNTPIDPTVDQFDKPIQHGEGRGTAFLTKQPSKRAQIVLQRVNAL